MGRHSRRELRDFLVEHSSSCGMKRSSSAGHAVERDDHVLSRHLVHQNTSLADQRRPWLSSSLFELDGRFKGSRIYPATLSVLLLVAYIGVHHQFGGHDIVLRSSGDPFGQAGWYVPVIATILYILGIHFGIPFMDRRPSPERYFLREIMIAYHGYQCLLSIYMAFFTFFIATEAGYSLWGNVYDPSRPMERMLGMMIWMHYFNHTIEMFDIVFIILRKRWADITSYRIFSQLVLLWGWFFVVKFHCGGDAYFAVISQQIVRFCTYSYYFLSLFGTKLPSWWKRLITAVQLSQYFVCLLHAGTLLCFMLYDDFRKRSFDSIFMPAFWLAILEGAVMFSLIAIFSNFEFRNGHTDEDRDEQAKNLSKKRRFVMSYDSSAWLYVYHFGVAYFVQKHITRRLEKDRVAYSGVSGGALVALWSCLNAEFGHMSNDEHRYAIPNAMHEIISRRSRCIPRIWDILKLVDEVLDEYVTEDAHIVASGRIRVMATRVGFAGNAYPIKGEVTTHFKSCSHLKKMIRASCHIPLVGGILPYDTGSGRYYDGFAWCNAFCVPWRSFRSDDMLVKVSAIGLPNCDIKPPWLTPFWWTVVPPKEEVLWGIFAQGYYDSCQFFQDVGLPWEMPDTKTEHLWKLPHNADRHLAAYHIERSWRVFGSLVFVVMTLTLHSYFPFLAVALMCWSMVSPIHIPSTPSYASSMLLPLSIYLVHKEFYDHYKQESFAAFTGYELLVELWPVITYVVVRKEIFVLLVISCMVLSDWSSIPILARYLSFAFLLVARLAHSFVFYYSTMEHF